MVHHKFSRMYIIMDDSKWSGFSALLLSFNKLHIFTAVQLINLIFMNKNSVFDESKHQMLKSPNKQIQST
jgi:hypothetical protein